MKAKLYATNEIIEYAALLQRSLKGTKYDLNDQMRRKFPGISDNAIRIAVKDARLLLAFRQLLRESKE
jgi:hypothetical protein